MERRKVLRREVNFDVSFSSESQKGKTKARQLSEFGILIGPVDHPKLLFEKHVQLQFTVPGAPTCNLRGYCAYVTPTAAGVRFETVPEETKSMLARFVNEDPAVRAGSA